MKGDNPNHTQNSLLCTIAGINGRFLSIICAVSLAFYMYYYQQEKTCRLRLDDLRLKVARTMVIPAFHDPCGLDVKDYFDANGLDIHKIVMAFYDQLGYNPDPRIEAILSTSGLNVAEVFQYDQRVGRLVSLINIAANIYPYSTRSRETSPGVVSIMYSDLRKDWTREWQRDLGSLNLELTWLWRQKRAAIEDLLRRHDEALIKDEVARQNGSPVPDLDLQKILGSTSRATIEQFFSTVEAINHDILPELNDYSFRLARYQTQLMNKTRLLHAIPPLVLILLFGILAPLIISLKPIHSVWWTVGVLILSVMSYIWLSLLLLFR
jgi:hypothetical protein